MNENEQEINDRIDILSDMLIETERCVATLAAREEEMRTMLIALIATHPNKEALAAMLEQAKTGAKSPNTPAGDSFPNESTLARDAFAQIVEKVRKNM